MALESLPKIAPALFSAEQDLIQIYNKKSDTLGVINASLIGGNTPPSGVSGAIQFSNGSAFASDAANFFWDNTNKRLGVGTNAPTNTFEIASTSASPFKVATTASYFRAIFQNASASGIFDFNSSSFQFPTNNVEFGTSSSLGARVGIRGSGSTSATTSLLVQNSAGASALSVKDDGYVTAHVGLFSLGALTGVNVAASNILYNAKFWNQSDGGTTIGAQAAPAASAILDIRSTTSGVLFPRMTTTQINNIASPAEGLIAYNTTISHLCCYQAGAWVKFSHSPM